MNISFTYPLFHAVTWNELLHCTGSMSNVPRVWWYRVIIAIVTSTRTAAEGREIGHGHGAD